MMNPNSDKSIVRHLTVDKDNPPELLIKEQLDDYAAVLYFDKAFGNVTIAANVSLKSPYYPNRYSDIVKQKSTRLGNDFGTWVEPVSPDPITTEKGNLYFIVYGYAKDDVPFDVVYTDPDTGEKTPVFSGVTKTKQGYFMNLFSVETTQEAGKNYSVATNFEVVVQE